MKIDKNEIKYIKKYLKNDKRINHSISTAKEMIKFADQYNVNKKYAKIAGLYHDIGKGLNNKQLMEFSKRYEHNPDKYERKNMNLLHPYASCYLLKKDNICSKTVVLKAIENHTIAKKNMSKLSKLLYVIDFSEPDRDYPEARIAYDILKNSLDDALFYVLKSTIGYILDKNSLVHPLSVNLYNELVMEGGFGG